MNVYDFDKTIFPVDSSTEFFKFCLRKYPRQVLHNAPGFSLAGAQYAAKRISAGPLKEQLFAFLSELPEPGKEVEAFWEKNFGRINAWYLEQKRPDDVIISASPEFLIGPAAQRLGVRFLATKMDIHTGRIAGSNCHDAEKTLRFRRAFPDAEVEAFYSDSLSDAPMARLAFRSYLVTAKGPQPWPADKL